MLMDFNLARLFLLISGTGKMKMMTLRMHGTKVIQKRIKAKIQIVKKQE